MPIAWVLLWGLMALLGVTSVASTFVSSDEKPSLVEERARAKEMILQSGFADMGRVTLDEQGFSELAKDISKGKMTDEQASLYLASKWLAGEAITAKDEDLMTSGWAPDEALYTLLTEEDLTRAEVRELADELEYGELEHRLVGAKALADRGDRSRLNNIVPPVALWGYLIFITIVIIALVLSPGLWVYYCVQRVNGKLKPQQGTMPELTAAQADGIALRAFFGLVGMFLSMELLYLLGVSIPRELLVAGSMIVSLIVIALIIRIPVQGHRITVSNVIGERRRPGLLAGWGIAGEWANLPFLAVALVVTIALKDVLPEATHPASESLMSDQSLPNVLSLFFSASVMAPIIEEILFRGLILSACLRFMSPVAAILLNGFVFAAIHPQGLAGIPPLMAIGVMLAMLTYQTGSLIPAMVAHAFSNTVVLLLNIVVN